MIATITQVEDAFAALLSQLGRVVVQGRIGEDGAPASPYAMWDLESVELSDFPTITVDGVEQHIISTNTPLIFQVNIVGGPAMTDAVKFGLSFRQSQRLNELYKFCGLSGISPPQDVTAVEVGTFRQRVQLRVTLFAAVDLLAAPETLEHQDTTLNAPEKDFSVTFRQTQGECH